MSEYKIGQKLWYVPTRGEAREMEITKVGRKWLTVGLDWQSERLDLETLRADGNGYSSPGTAYVDRFAYEKKMAVTSAWNKFLEEIRFSKVPKGIEVSDILQARVLLKMIVANIPSCYPYIKFYAEFTEEK